MNVELINALANMDGLTLVDIKGSVPTEARRKALATIRKVREQVGELIAKRELSDAWKALPATKTAADYAYLKWALPRLRLLTIPEIMALRSYAIVLNNLDRTAAKCLGLTEDGWEAVVTMTANAVAEKRSITYCVRSTKGLTSAPGIDTISGQEKESQVDGRQTVQAVRAAGGRKSELPKERAERFSWA